MEGGESAVVKHSAKVFGYIHQSLKERVVRLREVNSRLSESRLIDEGLQKIVEYYEGQLHPTQPAPHPAKKKS